MADIKRTKIKTALTEAKIGEQICIKGWVRTKRQFFINLNDGSTINNLQVIASAERFGQVLLDAITTGSSLSATGILVASQGAGQKVELEAQEIEILGTADPEKFPLQPKKHSLEFLREIAHLRPRTNTFGAILRVRHTLAYGIHKFYNDKGFVYVHTPIITGSDAEGAGEMFRVTTLDPKSPLLDDKGSVDYAKDFFGKQTNLTVSGQLEGELAALALTEIYTFGPTFRAENSNTSRHLAEFWMMEPEMAFYDIVDSMNLAEEMLKYLINYALEHCIDDLEFLNKRLMDEEKNKKQEERREMSLMDTLKFISENNFVRLTYTEAVEILRNSKPNKKKKFQFPIDEWGVDLQSGHERFLVEKHFKKPVILYNFPATIKAFYMRQNNDGQTVAAMDVLFPGIGEIIGGSQREERYDQLYSKITEMGIDEETLWWYLETRKFGTAPHSGFGLGFERLVQFVTGMGNIRDVIPFPRTPGSAEF